MNDLHERLIGDPDMPLEMATFGKPRWGEIDYKVAIHSPIIKEREIPHIHIYQLNDPYHNMFDFEISLIDILCVGKINLIYQLDRYNNIIRTHRNECSWIGYSDIYEGLEEFLHTNQNIFPYNDCLTGLEAAIVAYNAESNSRDNALKEYLFLSFVILKILSFASSDGSTPEKEFIYFSLFVIPIISKLNF